MTEQIVVTDEQKMLGRINDLPNQLEKAWTGLWTKEIPLTTAEIDRVLICGMGGSGIAGLLTKEALASETTLIETWADYQLPGWVNNKTLVVAVSYSGDTEETTDAVKEALTRQANIVIITKGGKLAKLAESANLPLVTIDYDSSPREAIGVLYGSVLTLLAKLKITKLTESDFMKAHNEFKAIVDGATFPAKAQELVPALSNKIPVVIAEKPLTAVAKRWANQCNENAKTFAVSAELPELCHNLAAGLDFPAPEKLHFLILESAYGFSRNLARSKVIQKILTDKEISFTPLSVRSGSVLSEQWSFIYFGDLLSYYLAGVNGVDPSPIETITYLKKELEQT